MATPRQIRLLRAGFNKTGTMNYYGDMLAAFGVDSDRDLSNDQVNTALEKLMALGYNVKLRKHKAPQSSRDGMITDSQVALLKRLWSINPHVIHKDDSSLLQFVKRILHVDALDWIARRDVGKIVNAIKSIKSKSENGK